MPSVNQLQIITTISEAHACFSLTKPNHPLVSVLKFEEIDFTQFKESVRFRVDLYQIWIREGANCHLGYGRTTYDFNEGSLAFIKPGQVLSSTDAQYNTPSKGVLILFHPDLIRKTNLGKVIDQFTFFDYEIREALYISDFERLTLNEIISKITFEINQNIDKHSQSLINANLELFLGYCLRFYDRQFYVRTNLNQYVISRLQAFLSAYYHAEKPLTEGIPSVAACAHHLHMSPHYLSDLLRKEVGKNSQDYIQDFVVERAKNLLLGTTEPLKQIAYALGYEYPQHFTKVFKTKTGLSPRLYRQITN